MATYTRTHSSYQAGDPILVEYLDAEFTTIFQALATGGIGAEQIENGGVGSDELAADAVTTVKILDDAITTAKIADSQITTAKIASGTIVAGDIANVSPATWGAGSESHTEVNGRITKTGYTAIGAVSGTVTFATGAGIDNFSGVTSITTSLKYSSNTLNTLVVTDLTTTDFDWNVGDAGMTGFWWTVIGY